MSGPGILRAIRLPIPIDELTKHTKTLPCDALMKQHGSHLLFITPDFAKVMACWCARCEGEAIDELERFDIWPSSTFVTCPDCGNKRCPRAGFHGYRCTRSNEYGQCGESEP